MFTLIEYYKSLIQSNNPIVHGGANASYPLRQGLKIGILSNRHIMELRWSRLSMEF